MMARRHMSLQYTPEDGDENAPVEPLTFDLKGEVFTCVDEIPATVMLKMGVAMDPDAEMWQQLKAIDQFFSTIVIEQDRDRFRRTLDNANPIIGTAELIQYMNKLIEAVVDRPTGGQQDSPTLLPSTPPTSTDDSSTPDTPGASSV